MKNLGFLSLLLSFFVVLGCDKPNPEAYRTDPVFQDYQQQLAATTTDYENLKKQAETTQKDLNTSAPQSGQANLHRKKLYEITNRMRNLEQQMRYWKVKIESQAKVSQGEYLTAHKEKKPWPDGGKTKAYFAQKRLRQAKMAWDQKDRIEQYEQEANQKASPAPAAGH